MRRLLTPDAEPSAPRPRAHRRVVLHALVPFLGLCVASATFAGASTHDAADGATFGASVDIPSKSSHPPSYPREAVRAGATGTVIVRVDVDAKGSLQNVSVVESSGHAALDAAAEEAARRWTYTPAMHEGSPAPGHVRIPIDFML
ncbi:energy transducer TonB [Luteimonas sp. WGS1318]|uniref:energy transducer TonB n=1 Tax=Luteimonas sp. WGS1318 TaxID=3366815 RepID=UPI00372CFD83